VEARERLIKKSGDTMGLPGKMTRLTLPPQSLSGKKGCSADSRARRLLLFAQASRFRNQLQNLAGLGGAYFTIFASAKSS
jgi:hypothetical protein